MQIKNNFYFFSKGKQIRDVVIYIDVARKNFESSLSIFSKDLNVNLESCNNGLTSNLSRNFEVKLISLEESASRSEHWLPVYVDNKEWNEIEFICHIHIEYNTLLDGRKFFHKNLKYVMIEDSTRSLCSIFKKTKMKKLSKSAKIISYIIGKLL